MSTATDATEVAARSSSGSGGPPADINRVPYLPGLDGMRAIAVVAVMIYHANPDWLKGGFLGVEVFFVISGYLITLLLISEKARTKTVDITSFWVRRARRLLPALFTLLIMLIIWTSLFERAALGKLRGDVIAAFFYVSNWYQIWTGAGYTEANDFAPLRHLWSLAVEEQFYLLWPLVMVFFLRGGINKVSGASRWLFLAAVGVTLVTAVLYHPGPVGTPEITPQAYWDIFGREISKADFLYLSTPTRASGLLLGAAFAMIWRPVAVMRGNLRDKGLLLDIGAILGAIVLAFLMWNMGFIGPDGTDPYLFRGGFFVADLATLAVIAAVTHQRAFTSRALSSPVLLWIGTRSYGLYLYHWPIYQLIRNIAGIHMKFHEFIAAMVLTVIITELSYRFIETPIRKGTVRASWNRIRNSPTPGRRNALYFGGIVFASFSFFGLYSLATAELQQNDVALSLVNAEESTCDVINDPDCSGANNDEPDEVPSTETTPSTDAGAVVDPLSSTTTVETTTTTAVPVTLDQLALGDSVMLGAAVQLDQNGLTVDAQESRAFINGLDTILTLQQQDRLGEVVVIHLGTNGAIGSDDMTQMMDALVDVPQVILITVDVPRDYTAGNNQLIFETAAAYSNVDVLDWAGLVSSCPGECLYDDGLHLRPDGQVYYAALIDGSIRVS
jgi:peptidoglycan/LPS O-acetylase OafA/YrhL